MRLRCRNLNEDLHSVNLAESPMCRCGEEIEDPVHFLKDCALYRDERRNLEVDLRHYDTEELLMGNPYLTKRQNEKMLSSSQIHYYFRAIPQVNCCLLGSSPLTALFIKFITVTFQ